jgi:hypothetical protein
VALAESPLFGPIRSHLLRANGFTRLFAETLIPEEPLFQPDTAGWAPPREPAPGAPRVAQDVDPLEAVRLAAAWLGAGEGGQPPAQRSLALRLHTAFASGRATPSEVAERVVAAVAESERMAPPMRLFIAFDAGRVRSQAAASTARYAAGRALSALDEVPFAVKDEVDVAGFPTTAGTSFLGER